MRGAAEGGSRNCTRGSASRRNRPHLLRCSRIGIECGTGERRHHRARQHSVQCGHLGGRSLEQPFLRELGTAAAAVKGPFERHAYCPRGRRSHDVHFHARLGLSQASGWGLYHRTRHGRLRRAPGARLFPFLTRIHTHSPQRRRQHPAQDQRAIMARVGYAAPVESGRSESFRADAHARPCTEQRLQSPSPAGHGAATSM
jgi:hypothetical protein